MIDARRTGAYCQTSATHQPASWLSITQYARAYGLDRSTVKKLLDVGLLDSYKVGRVIRVKNQPART